MSILDENKISTIFNGFLISMTFNLIQRNNIIILSSYKQLPNLLVSLKHFEYIYIQILKCYTTFKVR